MTREDAYSVLTEFTKNKNLVKHALAVEAAMKAYAKKYGEDEEKWAIVGLIHDFDYEKYPTMEDHPFRGAEILKERGWPEDIIRGVLCHAEHTGMERKTLMEKAIYAVDELTGFIIAVALVRPSKKIEDVKVKSVKKKMKDKLFAAKVDRNQIIQGAEELGVTLEDHIQTVLDAMKGIADELGL